MGSPRNKNKPNPFPEKGTFAEQKAYVDDLPTATTHSIADEALAVVEKSETPFNLTAKDIPEGVELEIFHHGAHEQKKETDDQPGTSQNESKESDDEGEEISGVITRTTNISSTTGTKKEKIVLHVPNQDNTSSVFAIKLNENGSLKSLKLKQKSIDAFKAGLHGRSGTVAKAKANDLGDGMRFTTVNGK